MYKPIPKTNKGSSVTCKHFLLIRDGLRPCLDFASLIWDSNEPMKWGQQDAEKLNYVKKA